MPVDNGCYIPPHRPYGPLLPNGEKIRERVLKTELARKLRREQTDVERRLWSRLRNRQLDGFKFKRQVPKGPYVVDFCCAEARLIVELDGDQHAFDENQKHDAERTRYLNESGYRVLRFWNIDVRENIDGVIESISIALKEPPLPEASVLSPQGGGG